MDVFLEIMLYSVLVLAALTVMAGAFVFVSVWLVNESGEPNAH